MRNTNRITAFGLAALSLVCALFLTGCGGGNPPLSIFEWRVSHGEMVWAEHIVDGEIYAITSKGSDYTLHRYNDNKEEWAQPIESEGSFTVNNALVAVSGDNQRTVYVFTYVSGKYELISFDQNGEQLSRLNLDGWAEKVHINDQTLGLLTYNGTFESGEYILKTLHQGQLQEIYAFDYTVTREVNLQSIQGNWIITDKDNNRITSIDNAGNENWHVQYGDDEHLGNVLFGKNMIVAEKRSSSVRGFYFVEAITGEKTFISEQSYHEPLFLDHNDRLYTSSDLYGSPIRKIDSLGHTLWESVERYHFGALEGAMMRMSPNGELVVLQNYKATDADGHTDSSIIHVLDEQGNLAKTYQPTPFKTTLVESGCVEFCTTKTVQPGYLLSALYIDQDDDYYVLGSMPKFVGPFLNSTEIFAKVDKTTSTE